MTTIMTVPITKPDEESKTPRLDNAADRGRRVDVVVASTFRAARRRGGADLVVMSGVDGNADLVIDKA